ncbi:MAG: carboxypeptidase regulatory-like domain-containing protein [Anaerolineae bacterium]|nr:carboxypeptidase regulatory-like domain-containing protein [Anaerolineae bacterium]
MRSILLALAVLAGLALCLTRALPTPLAAPAASLAAPAATGFDFVPASLTVAPGGAAVVNLRLRDAVDLAAYEVQLAFDPAIIAVDRVDRLVGTGNPPPAGRTWFSLPLSADPNVTFTPLAPGVIAFGAYSYGDAAAALDGDVLLARLTVHAVGTGTSALHLNTVLVSNPDAQGSQPPSTDGSVTISGGQCVTGTVHLQSRSDDSGATISSGPLTTVTASDGRFALCGLGPGTYTVTASHPSFLAQSASNVTLSGGVSQVSLPGITLLGGDIYKDQANKINILDLITIASVYGSLAATRPAADINGDGQIGLTDLIMVGANYNRTAQVWGAAGLAKRAAAEDERQTLAQKRAASVTLAQPPTVKAGEVFAVQARVSGAVGLAGADVSLRFDPARLESLGPADTGDVWPTDGVFVAANRVDEAAGEAHFAATALDSRAASQGTMLTLRFRARREGPPDVRLGQAHLVDEEGTPLLVNVASK